MSVQISYTKQTIFGILFIGIILLTIEGISVIILDQKDSCYVGLSDSGIYKKFDVNVKKLCNDYQSIITYHNPAKYSLPNQHSETVNINSMGFRGNEISIDKNDSQYRIFFLGGSTAFGLYSTSDHSTISGYLEEQFENTNIDVEVVNAAVYGANSFDETYIIKQKLMNLSPNLFIVYGGWNDLANTVQTEYKKKDFRDDINLTILHLKKYYKTITFIEFLDRVITKQIYGDKGKPEESFSNKSVSEKITLWKNRWNEICKIGNEKNFKTMIIIQPLLGAGNKQPHDWEKYMLQQYEHESVVSEYDLLRKALLDLNRHCTLVVDLTPVFDDRNELIYYDLGHIADHGNEIVAEEIYAKVLPIIKNDIQNLEPK